MLKDLPVGGSIVVGKAGFTELFKVRRNSPEWKAYEEQVRQIRNARRSSAPALHGTTGTRKRPRKR